MKFMYDTFSLRTTIQVCALTTILISSFFLIRGTMYLSINDIAKLSGTYLGYNPNLLNNLCAQKVDYSIGWSLLLLSFFLQTCNLLWPMRINDFAINRIGLIIGILLSIILFTASIGIAKSWRSKQTKKAEEVLEINNKNQ